MNAADALLAPHRVADNGSAVALACRDESVTFAELLARVNRFANGLLSLGIAPEQRVLMMMKDSADMVVAMLAAMKAGAVAVPVNLRATAAELALMLNDSRARLLLIDDEFLPLYRAVAGEVRCPHGVFVRGAAPAGLASLAAIGHDRSDSFSAVAMTPDDMAFWLYTSGTTGTPKAAVHLQHDVLVSERYAAECLGVGPGDRLFATSKLFFAYSLGNALFPALRLGATCVLYDAWPDGAAIAAMIDRHRPTAFFSVPTMYRNLLRDGVATRERFGGVRHCVSAGERLPVTLFEQWRQATGHAILDGIGTTETVYFFLAARPGTARAGSTGGPAPAASVELRDEQGAVVTTPGTPGVLWVRMPSTADRYWNQQERSKAAFVGPWFRTGDVYTFDADGYWYHEGRADDMLKISGQWVSPAEIEEHVLKLPQVSDCAVVGAANADGLVRLALFVVPRRTELEREALAAEIQSALAGTLSIYKCPREIRLIDEIPRTATGKIQRYRLKAAIDSGAR